MTALRDLLLSWNRSVVFLDTETTGTRPQTDRIVEIAAGRLEGEGFFSLINPGQPIPPEATAVHGITDEKVRDSPTFAECAATLALVLKPSVVIVGFGVERFDVPLLKAEFRRCGVDWTPGPVVDCGVLFHKREPRDLSAALRFYCDREHVGAHGAVADIAATMKVFAGQLERYADLRGLTPEELVRESSFRDPTWLDEAGKFRWERHDARIAFGKHAGKSLRVMVEEHGDYLHWLLGTDLSQDARQIVLAALDGSFPSNPLHATKESAHV